MAIGLPLIAIGGNEVTMQVPLMAINRRLAHAIALKDNVLITIPPFLEFPDQALRHLLQLCFTETDRRRRMVNC